MDIEELQTQTREMTKAVKALRRLVISAGPHAAQLVRDVQERVVGADEATAGARGKQVLADYQRLTETFHVAAATLEVLRDHVTQTVYDAKEAEAVRANRARKLGV